MTDRSSAFSRGPSDLSDTVRWVNTSIEGVPAYGVVQFRTDFSGGYNQASKPDGDDGLYFVNGPVEVAPSAKGESLVWGKARLVLLSAGLTVGDIVGPTADSWSMSEAGSGFIVMHQPVDGVGAVLQVGTGGGGHEIEFCVKSMSEGGDLLVEVLSYSRGGGAVPPEFDTETCTLTISNSCITPPESTGTLVGAKGFASYLYDFLITCEGSAEASPGTPSWRVTSICDIACSESTSSSSDSSSSSESSESSSNNSSDNSSGDSGSGGGGGGSSSDDCEKCQWVLIDVEFDPGTCTLIKLWCNRCTGELVRYNPFEPDSGSSSSGRV